MAHTYRLTSLKNFEWSYTLTEFGISNRNEVFFRLRAALIGY
ncbi:hypothetical protein [Sphingobacterium sp.]|nr:hypothetical protein [Sphingobacterium sp.]